MLRHQLAYPITQETVPRRLDEVQQDKGHVVLVAELSGGHVVGWVHVYVRHLLLADPHVEVGGLVIDEAYRRCGIGRHLMQWVEEWAHQKGCGVVFLRSNVVRRGAHVFYEKMDYANVKTSFTFRKVLET